MQDSPTRVLPLMAASRDAARARYGSGSVLKPGITIGMDRILAAGEVWLLVTGSRRAEVLRRALDEPEGPDPAASYVRRHPRLTVPADEATALLLPIRRRHPMLGACGWLACGLVARQLASGVLGSCQQGMSPGSKLTHSPGCAMAKTEWPDAP